MADKQESALTQQSDCKWVRALDANGNSIRISKEDLAAVVGGLLKFNLPIKGFLTDYNRLVPGIWDPYNAANTPIPEVNKSGNMIAFPHPSDINKVGLIFYIRYNLESLIVGYEGQWKKVDFTDI